jgi:hypothetical protein
LFHLRKTDHNTSSSLTKEKSFITLTPEERGAFPAKHDDLGEVFSQAITSPEVLVQLLPVAVFTEAGSKSYKTFFLPENKLERFYLESNGKLTEGEALYS